MMYKVGTTQQIVKQLHQEGYQISEYALRRWIAEGVIPSSNKVACRISSFSICRLVMPGVGFQVIM